MLYQRRSRKDMTESHMKAFDAEMLNDQRAGEEVAAFTRDNPPEMHRKGLVDFRKHQFPAKPVRTGNCGKAP